MKRFILFILMTLSLYASNYEIKYKGITLGKIESLDTLSQNYLKAKVSNPIVKMLLRKDYYVFYDGNKPDVKRAKFRKDNKKILFALKTAIELKPKNQNFIIDNKRNIVLKCQEENCTFDYFSSGKHNAHGIIEFDKNGEFSKLTETKSKVVIERN